MNIMVAESLYNIITAVHVLPLPVSTKREVKNGCRSALCHKSVNMCSCY